MKGSKLVRLACLICLAGALALAGCSKDQMVNAFSDVTGRSANDVHLSADNFQANLGSGLGAYRGKSILLSDFANRAENTKQFSYPALGKKMWYVVGHGSIEAYFWYCFRPALESVGVRVYQDSAPAEVPRLSLTLLHLDDHVFVGKVTVSRQGRVFGKDITVKVTPPDSEDRMVLTEAAYGYMNQIIAAILRDPEISAHLL
ncbi:MAG: hypothetical protein KQJ78_11545 [Deltaproteobacteria bacterium]|nr:hypothetical protein [Deltaproteobacteria bacterium]